MLHRQIHEYEPMNASSGDGDGDGDGDERFDYITLGSSLLDSPMREAPSTDLYADTTTRRSFRRRHHRHHHPNPIAVPIAIATTTITLPSPSPSPLDCGGKSSGL